MGCHSCYAGIWFLTDFDLNFVLIVGVKIQVSLELSSAGDHKFLHSALRQYNRHLLIHLNLDHHCSQTTEVAKNLRHSMIQKHLAKCYLQTRNFRIPCSSLLMFTVPYYYFYRAAVEITFKRKIKQFRDILVTNKAFKMNGKQYVVSPKED